MRLRWACEYSPSSTGSSLERPGGHARAAGHGRAASRRPGGSGPPVSGHARVRAPRLLLPRSRRTLARRRRVRRHRGALGDALPLGDRRLPSPRADGLPLDGRPPRAGRGDAERRALDGDADPRRDRRRGRGRDPRVEHRQRAPLCRRRSSHRRSACKRRRLWALVSRPRHRRRRRLVSGVRDLPARRRGRARRHRRAAPDRLVQRRRCGRHRGRRRNRGDGAGS